MADSSKMSPLKVSMNYATFNTFKLRAKAHIVGGKPTLNDVARFGSGRSANFKRDQFTTIFYA